LIVSPLVFLVSRSPFLQSGVCAHVRAPFCVCVCARARVRACVIINEICSVGNLLWSNQARYNTWTFGHWITTAGARFTTSTSTSVLGAQELSDNWLSCSRWTWLFSATLCIKIIFGEIWASLLLNRALHIQTYIGH
jgi:hypothetical protein